LDRAAKVNGAAEAFLVKLIAERPLSDPEVKLLGQFRQGVQSLRERVEKDSKLAWGSSVPSKYPEYAAFRDLSIRVARLLYTSPAVPPAKREADDIDHSTMNLLKATSNHWESTWVDEARVTELDKKYNEWRRSMEGPERAQGA
jgi:hypothetical protein